MVRYLLSTGNSFSRIRKIDKKDFIKELDFKDVRFPVKIKDIYKIYKKKFIRISVFGYEDKEKYQIYLLKILSREAYSFIVDRKRTQNAQ